MNIILQIIFGILYANLIEWIAHKYFLHFWGKTKNNLFSFHWYNHHKTSRTCSFRDENYDKPWWKVKVRKSEVISLFFISISQIWVFWFFPVFYITCVCWVFVYYFAHKKCHQNVKWGKRWMPWHYDHHMGRNQDLNWCVTFPFWDYILGTREKYYYNKDGKCEKLLQE